MIELKKNKLDAIVKNFTGDNAYYAKNLKNGELLYSKDTDKIFISASIIKIPIMVYAIKKIFNGSLNVKTLHTVSYEGMEEENENNSENNNNIIMFDIIKRMIIYSDNACTNYLIDLFTIEKLNNYFISLGLKNTVLNRKMLDYDSINGSINNYTTVSDMALLFEKMYKGQLLGLKQSNVMLAILAGQKDHTKIARHLPKEAQYFGKTGELPKVIHDIGIVSINQNDYLIAGFIQNADNEDIAMLNIADFTYSLIN